MRKILCIGQSTYDITYVVDSFPRENSKTKAKKMYASGGGSAGNMAYLMAKYGEEVSFISSFGADVYGDKIKEEYLKIGLDLKNCIISSEYETPLHFIITNSSNGSRTIVGYRKENIFPGNYQPQYEDEPEMIVMDGYYSDLAKFMLEKFPEAISVLDAGSLKEEFVELGKLVTYFICSENFAMDYCNIDRIDEEDFDKVLTKLSEINNKNVVVTLGERGCIYKESGNVNQVPVFKVKVVDTTGAGDIFHGAFAYAIVNGYDMNKSLVFASACSALAISKVGGRRSIPDKNEVLEMLGLT